MATARDAQTFLLKIKEKYPQYNSFDDATLMNKIKEKYPQYKDIQANTLPASESLLERATKGIKDVMKIAQGTEEGFADAYTLGGTYLARKGAEKLVPLSGEAEKKYKDITEVNPVAKGIGALIPAVKGAFDIGKGTVNAFRTGPLKAQAESLAYTGANEIKEKAPQLMEEAFNKFGDKFSKLKSTATTDNFNKAIFKSIDELGEQTVDIPGTPANKLYSLLEDGSKQLDPVAFQAKSKAILNSLGKDVRGKAIFYKHLMDELPNTIPGLVEAKAEVAPAYKLAGNAKKFTRATIKRVAGLSKGRAPIEEINDLKSAESSFRTNIIGEAQDIGNKLEKVMRNKKVGIALGVPTLGALATKGIQWLVGKKH